MKQGFTLIEILVAATIFVIVITAFLNLFVSAFHFQKQATLQVELLNSASYISEYLSRALRMARKDTNGTCVDENYNYKTESSDTKIRFLNGDGKCQEFFKDGTTLKVNKSSDENPPALVEAEPLSPSDFLITNLRFNLWGDGQDNNEQPKVSFVIEMETQGAESKKIHLQTTVSQRQLDVTY